MELTRNQNGGINMLYKYFTEKLTGLQGLSIEKVEEKPSLAPEINASNKGTFFKMPNIIINPTTQGIM